MEKRVYFAIATGIVGLAMGIWVKASVMESKDAQPKFELSSSLANPYLVIRTLDAVY
jgi:hypothetical protein